MQSGPSSSNAASVSSGRFYMSIYPGTILIQFLPAHVTLGFQKEIFSTDCSQPMGLQSVLKTRGKTSKLFALQRTSIAIFGSKPQVNFDAFVFSKYIAATKFSTKFSMYSKFSIRVPTGQHCVRTHSCSNKQIRSHRSGSYCTIVKQKIIYQ